MKFCKLLEKLRSSFPGTLKVYLLRKGKVITEFPVRDFCEEVELTDDTRTIKENSVYFSTYFARPYLADAIAKKPYALFLSRKERENLENGKYEGIILTGVRSPDYYFGHAASIYYGNPSSSMFVVAVTGTNGKTTTSFMIYHLWKKRNIPAAVIGTLGVFYWDGKKEEHFPTGFTTPKAVDLHKILSFLLEKNIRHAVLEASSEALQLRRLEGLTIQKAIFTTFGRDHLNFHKTLRSYFFAKLHLFFLTRRTSRLDVPFVTVYQEDTYPLFVSFLKKTRSKIHFLRDENLDTPFVTSQPFPVTFNRYNALCAFYGVEDTGTSFSFQDTPLSDFPGVPGRVERISVPGKFDVIIDYAHTPDALETLLKNMRNVYSTIITVFGCGGDRDREKRPLMGNIAETYSDIVIITDDNPRTEDPATIRKEIRDGMAHRKEIHEIPDRKQAIHFAIKKAGHLQEKNTAVIIAGKGHETYQIIGKEKIPFSDREAVREALQNF